MIVGDEDRLRQVVANVVGNALVHTEPDAPDLDPRRSRRRARDARGRGRTGRACPPRSPSGSTERFYRADPARSRHRGGSGLGLSIVDAAVAAHGGSVDIDSEPGRGTCVRLTLPRSLTRLTASSVAPAVRSPPVAPHRHRQVLPAADAPRRRQSAGADAGRHAADLRVHAAPRRRPRPRRGGVDMGAVRGGPDPGQGPPGGRDRPPAGHAGGRAADARNTTNVSCRSSSAPATGTASTG